MLHPLDVQKAKKALDSGGLASVTPHRGLCPLDLRLRPPLSARATALASRHGPRTFWHLSAPMGGWPYQGSVPSAGHLSRYVTSHPVQLSLSIPSWVGTMSTSQRAVMPCGRGVKADMVRVWVAGKTVWSPRYTRPISECLSSGASHNKVLYK